MPLQEISTLSLSQSGALLTRQVKLCRVPAIKDSLLYAARKIGRLWDSSTRPSYVMPWVSDGGGMKTRTMLICTDKAMRTRHLSPNATCTFNALPGEANGSNRLSVPDIIIPGRNPGRSPDLSQARPSTSEANEVDFGQYVDEVSCLLTGWNVADCRLRSVFRRKCPWKSSCSCSDVWGEWWRHVWGERLY